MSNLSDKTLEMAEKIALAEVEASVAKSRERQCDKHEFKKWDKVTCFDCGEDMVQGRLDAGRVRCVDCQTIAERKGNG